jgi:hypothetical protein
VVLTFRVRTPRGLNLNGLNYGENWLGGDWGTGHFLYSYDRFFDYCEDC